jgi:chemotaxis signal transduction protein
VQDFSGIAPLENTEKAHTLTMTSAQPAPANSALIFVRSGQIYALDARLVRGITPLEAMTRVAGAPRAVLGVMGWRGNALPLVDLVETAGSTPRAGVVVQCEAGEFALVADEVRAFGTEPGDAQWLDPDRIFRTIRDAIRRGGSEVEPGRE